ncbi:zinc finger protein 541 [Manis pentadactyla]|uniref:zinc finger protein 541 n=1 Tax=Manis pentadactyla TaxID=143292 RepID=UPI00255CEB62|nr:zinc finger protein 541 [Manis pentadactyla]
MDQNSAGEEGALPSEIHLPSFSESQGLTCSNALNQDLGPSSQDLLYAGLSGLDMDPSLPAPNVPSKVLEDNLDAFSLYSGEDHDSVKLLEKYADPASQASLQDLRLGKLKVPREADEGGRATSGSTRKRKRHHTPQNPLLDCSLCGKVFSSASSLSKHYLTHSQERKHVCGICSKAFKRQDHLTGHMLTHQKTKPFVCMEQGCSKSYCDYRSLRRHYEVQHGLCILKEAPPEEEACGDSSPAHKVAGKPATGGLRFSGSLLPNRDLLRCIVSSMVHQEISSPGPVLAGPSDDGEGKNTACSCPPSLGPYPCTPAAPGTLGSDVPEECHPLWKEPAAGFTAIHSRVAEDGGPHPAESERPPQLPHTLESGQEGGTLPAGLPLFQGQAVPTSAEPSNHNFQWLRNLPGCPKSKGNDVFVIQKPTSVSPQEGSESGPRPSSTSLTGEASGKPGYAGKEEDSRASKKSKFDSDSCSWQHLKEPSLQEALKPSGLSSDATPLLGQLFLKSQECLVSQEQMQVFQMITKSQRIISGSQVAVASSQHAVPEGKQAALKPLQGLRPHQPPPLAPTVDSLHGGPANLEPEGSPPGKRKTMPAFPREALPSSNRRDTKGEPKVTPEPSEPPGNPDVSSLAKQLRSTKGPLDPTGGPQQTQLGGDDPARTQLPEKQAQVENGLASGARKGAKGSACSRGRGRRLFSGDMQAQRFSDFQKEKVKMDTRCAASPSQVAMASFSSARPSVDPPQDSKSKLTISNRIQGGNTYRLPDPVKEESTAGGCNHQNGGPADWAEPRSTYVCKNCSQMFYTEKGLTSHMCFHSDQWLSPRGNQDQQVSGMEFFKPLRQVLRPEVEAQSHAGARKPSDSTSTAPLGMPASEPVGPVSWPPGSTAKGQDRDGEERDSKESSQLRRRRKCPQPKASFLLPPHSAFGGPGPEGHQSCLRSPVLLVDHFMKGLYQYSPYTPPLMLSTIREGSGLYFNTLCSMSSQSGLDRLISSKLDQVDDSPDIRVIKDDTKPRVRSRINIGSRFQAEIPELQERPVAETSEHGASLVWKPWGDVMSNPETQDRVTELCNVACSSAMPGGGTNLELALHCLHEAQGDVLVALETLLLSGPQKPPTHPLANYHYAGSDVWTPTEKELFNKAFQAHKKDFSLIHKMVQTKTVAQCVEYYYTWQKRIKFDCGRAPGLGKRVRRKLGQADPTETKATCSPKKRRNHHPTLELKTETESGRGESVITASPSAAPKRIPEPPGRVQGQGAFPCRECERVFDKIKSRNAHMKRHRLQDPVEPSVRAERPAKAFQLKEEEKEEEGEMGADMGPLQG